MGPGRAGEATSSTTPSHLAGEDQPALWTALRLSTIPLAAALASSLAILGLLSIWSTVLLLWSLWTTDALKSIGMLVPVVSFVLVLRAWRSLHFELDGSWWGFALLLCTSLLVAIRDRSMIEIVLSPSWTIFFPPHSLVVVAYGTGVVLLFGGYRLLRATLFPVALLFLVNPVPHIFNVYVDLPLQRASAHVARAFAMALGQPLSPDKLRLMFTPDFGMFIAPGCNGIRGAVTMGFIALVAGYLYRFRWRAHLLVVAGAILLGYLFNFVRLCVLVLYYLVALKIPWLQSRAENADYVIGAVLFFLAVYLLYLAIQRLSPVAAEMALNPTTAHTYEIARPGFYWKAGAMALLVLVAGWGILRTVAAQTPSAELRADETAMGAFPATLGDFTLVRTWNETLLTGALLFHWAEYAPLGAGTHVAIGVSPVLGAHDTMVCHSARGEDPLWHGQEQFQTVGESVPFHGAFFNTGATLSLEETTLCNGSSCGEYTSPPARFGIVYSKPHPLALLSQSSQRPIPILLRAETVDTTLPPDVARQALRGSMQDFLRFVSLDALTAPYRKR